MVRMKRFLRSVTYASRRVKQRFAGSAAVKAAVKAAGSAAGATAAAAVVEMFRNSGQGPMTLSQLGTGRRGPSAPVATQTNPRSQRLALGGQSAYFAGKVRRRFRTNKRMMKRYRKMFRGVNFNFERTAIVQDDKCVYVQHSTAPVLNIAKFMCYVLVKRVLNAGGVVFGSFLEGRAQTVPTGDKFQIAWKSTIAGTPSYLQYQVIVPDLNYEAIANGLWNSVFANLINSATGFTAQSLFLSAEWVDGVSNHVKGQINLNGAYMSYVVKGSLKMQNRSVSATTDLQSDDVDCVPLHGKAYYTNGNGHISKSYNSLIAPCDLTYAWNSFSAGADTEFQEPPQQYQFATCKGVTKVSIQPSKIKTSILTDKKRMQLNTFFRILNGLYIAASDTNIFTTLGKSRLFALERAIARLSTDTTTAGQAITLACEHDMKVWVDLDLKRQEYSTPSNQVL